MGVKVNLHWRPLRETGQDGWTSATACAALRKCLAELGDAWPTDAARHRAHGGIRTLRAHGERVIYDLGVLPVAPGVADLYLIDGEMRRIPATEYELLELARTGLYDA